MISIIISIPSFLFSFLEINISTLLAYSLIFIIFEMQVNLSQNSLEEYLSIVKNFMLEIHQRIGEEYDYPMIESQLISVIDRASVKIRTQKEQIDILQQQLKEADMQKLNLKDMKSQYNHLEKRLSQKGDEISILRQTVKTLYQDNERISSEKEIMGKEIASLKENGSSLKKRLKRQEDEILNHKNQLKKLMGATEDKLEEYLKEDEHKQTLIKKLSSEVDKLKAETNKKQKSLVAANKKLEELKNMQQERDKMVRLAETLKEENSLLMNELQFQKQKQFDEKSKWFKEADSLKTAIDSLKQRNQIQKVQISDLTSKFSCAAQKIVNYQNQIVMRTQKLKEKSKQVKLYTEEINKLAARVEELSVMLDQVLADNQELTQKCHGLEERLEELRSFQNYVAKLKGDINHKKSQELGKLMESLNKLQGQG